MKLEFNQVIAFMEKFGLDQYISGNVQHLSPEMAVFRIKFLFEEAIEYAHANGFSVSVKNKKIMIKADHPDYSLNKCLDALVDLQYVLIGTAIQHGFQLPTPYGMSIFEEAWRRVHVANLKKVRAPAPTDRSNGLTVDIIKPEGWRAPVFNDLTGED